MPRKLLILTADDFGLHEAVNEAVEQASRHGVLTAASLMVGAPAAADAVRRAQDLPRLRVGLHVVMADGWATLAPELIPALADGQGRMDPGMLRKSLAIFGRARVRAQVEAEIRAQFAAFERWRLPLDHVNVHKHFHMHPTILEILLRVAREHGAPPMRLPNEPLWFAAQHGGLGGASSAALLAPWVTLMKRRLRRAGVRHNDATFGVAASGAMDEGTLLTILSRLPDGVTEIYLHPATESGRRIAPTMSGYRHAHELEALLSPEVRAAIERTGAQLGGFRDVFPAGRLPVRQKG